MAPVLVQGRVNLRPLTSSITFFPASPPHHTSFPCSNLSSSLSEAHLPLDLVFTAQNRETKPGPSRKRLKPCRTSMLPQRPFGEPHRSRQDVAGRGGMKPELNPLKQPKHVPASLESPPPSPVMRSTTLEQASVCNIASPPAHAPPASFFSHPLELQEAAFFSDSDDEEFVKRSTFGMALAMCAAVQLINITDALSHWVSRLRLRYYDSPFTYREVSMRSKLGRVGIFWDIENCPVPGSIDAQMVVKQMHRIGASFGTIQCLRAYGKLEYLTKQAPSLLSMGVELCPVPDGKESADKAIIMDALLFAFDHKPCPDMPPVDKLAPQGNQGDGIVLVTGDRGFSALLRELSNRQITTVVIGNGHQKIPPILAQAADFSIQWDEMMETSDLPPSSNGRNSTLVEKVSVVEDEQLEFGGWDASSSCNVLLKYEPRVEEGAPAGCVNSQIEEGDTRDVEETTARNFDLSGMATPEEAQGIIFNPRVFQHNDSAGNQFSMYRQFETLDPIASDVYDDMFSGPGTDVEISTALNFSSVGKGSRVRHQGPIGLDYSNCNESGIPKILAPVGGRVRILRHLRCEVAYVVEKHCKGTPKAALSFEQFELLYELEMGHALASSHYGFASLKSLLQSMPDIVSLHFISLETADWRICPYVKRNAGDRKTRTNYSRQDLRCILYKILHSLWPHGVPKDQLSSEHCKLTGRPLVLVAYEYWKLSDILHSMGDMMYSDTKNKRIYLVDGAPEPQGLHGRAKSGWS